MSQTVWKTNSLLKSNQSMNTQSVLVRDRYLFILYLGPGLMRYVLFGSKTDEAGQGDIRDAELDSIPPSTTYSSYIFNLKFKFLFFGKMCDNSRT